MKISKLSLILLLASTVTPYDEVRKEPVYKLKGSHENAKPLPKRKKNKKRGY